MRHWKSESRSARPNCTSLPSGFGLKLRSGEQIEEELLRARKIESLGVMAGGIAHDFNNFLTVVQGSIEMAKASLGDAHPVQANPR